MTRWGIIGAGNIAHRFCASLSNIENSSLYAISGRNREKLETFAQEYPCEKIYVGYEELLKDENVDAVYIALPHIYHAEWIIKAAQYKKDILVEKPAVISYEEALQIQKTIKENGVVFMEAMKNVYTPAYQKLIEIIQTNQYGVLQSVQVQHGFQFPQERIGLTYHTQANGGGCLYDVGCYGLGFIHPFVQGIPTVQKTYANVMKGVDYYVQSNLQFDNVVVQLTSAFDRNLEAVATLQCEKATIKVSPMHRPDHIEMIVNNQIVEVIDLPLEVDDFYPEIQAFENYRNHQDNVIIGIEDTVQIAQYNDIIRDSFTKYDEHDLHVLEEMERVFTMDALTSLDAFAIGSSIISLLPEYDRGISLQIVRESDQCTIFQYISDDKKATNLMYAEGKHQAIYDFKHSSAWYYVYSQIHGVDENSKALPSGGAFPIYNNEHVLIASILISGLHEGKDHELIIRGLQKVFHKEVNDFKKALG